MGGILLCDFCLFLSFPVKGAPANVEDSPGGGPAPGYSGCGRPSGCGFSGAGRQTVPAGSQPVRPCRPDVLCAVRALRAGSWARTMATKITAQPTAP